VLFLSARLTLPHTLFFSHDPMCQPSPVQPGPAPFKASVLLWLWLWLWLWLERRGEERRGERIEKSPSIASESALRFSSSSLCFLCVRQIERTWLGSYCRIACRYSAKKLHVCFFRIQRDSSSFLRPLCLLSLAACLSFLCRWSTDDHSASLIHTTDN
jgi:hypothetical protein